MTILVHSVSCSVFILSGCSAEYDIRTLSLFYFNIHGTWTHVFRIVNGATKLCDQVATWWWRWWEGAHVRRDRGSMRASPPPRDPSRVATSNTTRNLISDINCQIIHSKRKPRISSICQSLCNPDQK